jgi:DNA (cytosine-5)-methyltransferase 1
MRIIKEMRDATKDSFPRVVVWENVVGALSSNGGADFGTVLDEMAEAGAMVVEWSVLDAQHFGVPQRRRRVFVVAVFDSATAEGCPDPLLPVRESVRGDSAKGRKKGEATAGETPQCFINSGFGRWAGSDVADTLAQRDYKGGMTLHVEPFVKSRRAQTSDDDETWVSGQVNPTLNQFDMGDTRATTAIVQPISIQDGREIEKRQNGLGTKQSTGVVADMIVRRLTPTECERLMGWPDNHTRWTDTGKEQADTHRYRQCGNGVATPVAQWIAGHLLPILATTTTTTTTDA